MNLLDIRRTHTPSTAVHVLDPRTAASSPGCFSPSIFFPAAWCRLGRPVRSSPGFSITADSSRLFSAAPRHRAAWKASALTPPLQHPLAQVAVQHSDLELPEPKGQAAGGQEKDPLHLFCLTSSPHPPFHSPSLGRVSLQFSFLHETRPYVSFPFCLSFHALFHIPSSSPSVADLLALRERRNQQNRNPPPPIRKTPPQTHRTARPFCALRRPGPFVSLPSKLRSVISTSTSSPPPSKKHTHTNYTFAFRLASPVSRPPCLPLRSSTARSGPFTKVAASSKKQLKQP